MAAKNQFKPEQENHDTLERFFQALARHDVDAAADLLHDDHVGEYPQSGERINGKGDWRKIAENYPGLPTMTDHSFKLSGDLAIDEMVCEYEGHRVYVCAISELQDGKIKKAREYFAEPFEAPEWRAQWVEKMQQGPYPPNTTRRRKQ